MWRRSWCGDFGAGNGWGEIDSDPTSYYFSPEVRVSLTSHLKNPGSPVRGFFKQCLPNVSEPLRGARTALKDADTIRPADPTAPSRPWEWPSTTGFATTLP